MISRFAAIFLLITAASVTAQQSAPVVGVSGGQIQGRLQPSGGAAFKGIPFAQPPAGDLRWREPQPVKAWTGVRQAGEYGAPCPQSDGGWNKKPAALSSEDCLYLNVWAPEWPSKSKKAVMVWVHGGANTGGSSLGEGGIEPSFDGTSLAGHGVIVVTIHYRLGLFGFVGHPELTAESPHHASGGYGLLDQIAALEWVRDNIERFGGDPKNVTVFGQSAGSQDLSILIASPLSKGLFQRAILESGTPMLGDKRLQTPAQTEQLGVILAHALKAPETGAVKYMRSLPTAQILAATADFRQGLNGLIFDVGMDGYAVPEFSPAVYKAGKEAPVSMIVGNTARETSGRGAAGRPVAEALKGQIETRYRNHPDLKEKISKIYGLEGKDVVASSYPPYGDAVTQFGADEGFRCQAVMLADWHSAVAPTYEFEFTAGTDEHPPVHSGELASVFGYLPSWASDPKFHKLSEAMQKYWTNFAKTGDPNGTGLPKWDKHDTKSRAYMELGNEGPTAKSALRATTCAVYAEKLNRDIDARKK